MILMLIEINFCSEKVKQKIFIVFFAKIKLWCSIRKRIAVEKILFPSLKPYIRILINATYRQNL